VCQRLVIAGQGATVDDPQLIHGEFEVTDDGHEGKLSIGTRSRMLALRSRRVPALALPLLGRVLVTVLVVVWLTSALWFLTGGTPDY